MEVDVTLQRTLELYLDNALPPEERIAFQQQIEDNPDLTEELRLQRGINVLLETGRRLEIEQELEHIAQRNPYTHSLWQQPIFWKLAAAVSLLLLCTLLLLRPQQSAEVLIAQMVQEQWQAYPNRLTSTLSMSNSASEWRGEKALTEKSRLLSAMELYEKGAYQQALDSMETLMHIPEVEQTGTLFYQGMCLMMMDQFRPAIKQLGKIPNTDQLYYGLAQWHLGLVWLKLENPMQAKVHLNNALSQPQLGEPEEKKVKQLLKLLPD